MSYHRRKSRFPELIKDANGKYLCRGCHGTVPPKRKTWCSHECKKKHDPFYVNRAAWERDKGRCKMCDMDCRHVKYGRWNAKVEYDHIIPYSEGGATVLENIQCLCPPCHRAKTAAWRKSKRKKPAQVELGFEIARKGDK